MSNLNLVIDRDSETPAYRQIYKQISSLITEGGLPAGSYLPKIRSLAQDLGIARNTVEAAYKQLAIEGYATGKRGRGYIVEKLDLWPLSSSPKGYQYIEQQSFSPTLPGRNPLGDDYSCKYDFSYGNRLPEDFPMQLWRTHAEKVMTKDYSKLAASYMDPMGLPALRQQIAKYLGETRNVNCDPAQIALLPGTQTALHKISSIFSDHERILGMEDPGYDAAREVFQDCGWEIRSIPTFKSATTYINSVISSGAKILFCTPSNQFPLGYMLPISTRLELIGWAKRTNSYIIEDDYCCEYRYDGSSPIPSLQSLDPDHVIYMGTLSKVLTPAIRISFVVIPSALMPKWEQVHGHYYCPLDWMNQAIVHSLMSSPDWNRYVHATKNQYHHKHAVLMKAIERELGNNVNLIGENAGLHLLVGDVEKRNQSQLIELARRNNVRVYETSHYLMDKQHFMDNYVLVGFSAISEEDIEPGIKALAQAWYEK